MSPEVEGGKENSGKDSNTQKGFMRMPENLMNAEAVGMDHSHTSHFKGMPCIGHVQHALEGAEHQWQREWALQMNLS